MPATLASRHAGHPLRVLLGFALLLCLAWPAAGQGQTGSQPMTTAETAKAYRAMAEQSEQAAQRISDMLPDASEDIKEAGQALVEARKKEAALALKAAELTEAKDPAQLEEVQTQLATASESARAAFEWLRALEAAAQLRRDVDQSKAGQAQVPDALQPFFAQMIASKNAAAKAWDEAATELQLAGSSVDSINAVGRARGAQMQSEYDEKAYQLNSSLLQVRQVAQKVGSAEANQIAGQYEQVVNQILQREQQRMEARWALYGLQARQQVLIAQLEQAAAGAER